MAPDIESVPNRAGKPAIPPRGARREGKRIRRRTVANLSRLPPEIVAGFRAVLKGAVAVSDVGDLMRVERSLPHGHAAAVPGTARDVGPGRMLHRTRSRGRDLALAAVVARVLWPDSKPATARRLSPETATGSLGAPLGLGEVTGNEALSMPGWLLGRQPWIEKGLANRHLRGGNALILYDVSSSYLEGRRCPLAAFGHNRDGKRGRMQVTYGLLCAADGCPVAVEVFCGRRDADCHKSCAGTRRRPTPAGCGGDGCRVGEFRHSDRIPDKHACLWPRRLQVHGFHADWRTA